MRRHNPLFLIGFINLVLAGCASQALRLPQAETEPPAATAPVVRATDTASSVALQALSYLGTPYRMGGESPLSGFDCSGLVVYAYREGAGLALPRNTYGLSHTGEPVARDELRPGDLVFYNTQRRAYSHVGIYLGGNRFIHAPSSGGAVRIDNLRAGYWMRRYSGARRIVESPPG
ncbi:MAG TPA: C40 family peptidase [Burkholderiales bacterium]|nr:C40 family peptidase [Burkholderiales bacterium]